MKNLREMKVTELKEMAKEMRISNWWNLKKEKLIEKIEEKQNRSDEEKAAEAKQREEEERLLDIYDKNWSSYGPKYDPIDFLNKVKSGEIILEDEEPKAKEDQQPELVPMPGIDKFADFKKEHEETSATVLTPKRGALIEYDGRSQNICAWGEELGISPNTLYGRLYKMGWSVERAFTTPGKKKK